MPSEREQRAKRLAEDALRLDPRDREPFLDKACTGDAALREEVELLNAHGQPTIRSLTEPSERLASGSGMGETVTSLPPAESLRESQTDSIEGLRFGPYRAIHEIGHGGMGEVYLAARADEQFKRRVAIKLLRRGMETEELVRRFRNERQILASIAHPHIANLLDGGTTEEGLPYLVMEYIEGQAIDRYCDSHKLSIVERLKLFREVCPAVHFAHQNLVVHRDLKPSNILVTEEGVPKLLDFGIAKLLKPEMYSSSLEETRVDTRVMTPEYASPEQVRGGPITTSSDVYSLGVLLYELLTGHRPYHLKNRPMHDVTRIICEEEPTRPSTVVGEEKEVLGTDGVARKLTPESVSKARGEQPGQLRRRLSGDLDNIVLMAMRKEPQRRYGSVEQLSEDIRRHLEGLPVMARKDTVAYRSSKFIQRHKAGVVAAAAFVALLLGFGVTMALQSSRIAAERDRAEREASKAKAINEFLQETLGSANPHEGMGREVTVLEALDAAVGKIGESFAEQPEIEAAVRNTVGLTYLRLGRYDEAEPLLKSALEMTRTAMGDEHLQVAETLTSLGGLSLYRGDYKAAESLFREALGMLRKDLGKHPEVAGSLSNLALSLNYQGNYEAAEPFHREALAMRRELLGEEHPEVAESLNNLAFLLHDKGDYENAERLYREVVAMDRKLLDNEHPDLATDLDNFASLLDDKGDHEAAEPLFREALAMRRKLLGDEHPEVAKSLNNLASMLERRGDNDAAEPLYREAIAIRRRIFEGDHPELATNLNNLARLLTAKGDYPQAAELFQQALAMYGRVLREDHWLVASSRSNYGECLTKMGRHAEAEEQLLAADVALKRALGERHDRTRSTAKRLVELYEAWGKPEKASHYRARLAVTDESQQ